MDITLEKTHDPDGELLWFTHIHLLSFIIPATVPSAVVTQPPLGRTAKLPHHPNRLQ